MSNYLTDTDYVEPTAYGWKRHHIVWCALAINFGAYALAGVAVWYCWP